MRAREQRLEEPLAHQGVASASTDLRATREAAGTLLGQLSPYERAAVVLKGVFDLSLEETAEALATTVGAVKAALYRGRGNRLGGSLLARREPQIRLARCAATGFACTQIGRHFDESAQQECGPFPVGWPRARCGCWARIARPECRHLPPSATPVNKRHRMRNGQFRMGIALALLLVLTRVGHFGHDLVPTDASWAVFLLGGAFLRGTPAFLGLCALAVGVDLTAFALGASAVCASPGYVFLLPTYATLWWVGRVGGAGEVRRLSRVGAMAVLGTVAAYAISNAGYFTFAPDLAAMSLSNFVRQVAPYLPSYVIATLLYTLTGHLLVHAVAALRPIVRPQHDDAG
jgi:hypothetical protein